MKSISRIILVFIILSIPTVVRSAEFIWDRNMTPSGVGIGSLYMVGSIIDGDYDRFVSAIKKRGAKPFILYVRSGGGNVSEAMKIGRLVRQLSLTVYAPLSTLQNMNTASCDADVGSVGKPVPCICASACTLIWFGGVMRIGLAVYIHSIKYNETYFGSLSPQQAQIMYQHAMQEVHTYLAEMDIDDKYYYMMVRTGSSELQRASGHIGGDLGGWTPAYREWLYAKCGAPVEGDTSPAWGMCTVNVGNQAEVEAIRKVLNSQ